VGILFLGLIFQSCTKSETDIEKSEPLSELFEKNEVNNELKDLSLALNKVIVGNKEFRQVLKRGVLQKFDGDYNVLLTNFVKEKVKDETNMVKTGIIEHTVLDILEQSYIEQAKKEPLKSDITYIEEMLKKHPRLQIAIPVNAENWESDSFVPVIAFVPSEFEEGVTKTISGYDKDGKIVHLSTEIEPTEPVIVINFNERIIDPGDILPDGIPDTPTLAAFTTQSGIRLTWNMPATSNYMNVDGYSIYRKGANTNFVYISSVYGFNNKAFDDNTVESTASYSYYVVSTFSGVESNGSNIVTLAAPNKPKAPLSFKAILHSKYEAELRWDNDHSQYISKTNIHKRVVANSNYWFWNSFNPDINNTFDRSLTEGKKTEYKIEHVTDMGVSNAKYDFVIVPYRNPAEYSSIIIKRIEFTDWALESWINGAPEFKIDIMSANENSKVTGPVTGQIIIHFDKRTKSENFAKVVYNTWKPGIWYEVFTFHAAEFDAIEWNVTFNLSAKYGFKLDSLNLGLDAAASAGFKYNFGSKMCGYSYLHYFDPKTKILTFPNYGTKITIGAE
jgi:hypothetical protein